MVDKPEQISKENPIDGSINKSTNLHWVGIGASAGGLEALSGMVKHLPPKESNTTYIIAQHLSPKHQSMMVQLLSRETNLAVEVLTNGLEPKAGIVYITPPNNDVFVKSGVINLRKPMSEYSPKPSVDLFFSSLAGEIGECAIGVILSGTGSDGAHGIKAIRAGGGLCIAQNPDTAKYDGMPNKAIETGCVDLILSPDQIGAQLDTIVKSPHKLKIIQETEEKKTALQEILIRLKAQTGVDFKDYKTGTLYRRLNRRMTACSVADIDEYLGYIKKNEQELDFLFRDIMISVTQFFRDKEAFLEIKEKIKDIVSEKDDGESIRIWVPGCATGEEAYSIVMLFAEATGGLSQLQHRYNFQLFATDIDTDALS